MPSVASYCHWCSGPEHRCCFESAAGCRDRLCRVQSIERSHGDDGKLARVLLCVPGSGDSEPDAAGEDSISPSNGNAEDDQTWNEIDAWLTAAASQSALESNRLGLMGHYYNGMLDVMTDVTQIAITFGSHVEILEVDELSGLRAEIGDAAIARE